MPRLVRCYCMVAVKVWKPTATELHSRQCEYSELERRAEVNATDPFAYPAAYAETDDIPLLNLGTGWQAWDGSVAWFPAPPSEQ